MVYAIKGIHDIQRIKETNLSVFGSGRNAEIVKAWLGKKLDQTSQNILVIQDRNNRLCGDFQCNRGNVYILPDCVVDEIAFMLNNNFTGRF